MASRRRVAGIFAVGTALASLLVNTQPAGATFPGPNGRISYVTTVGDQRQIHTVRPDGLFPEALIALPGRDAIQPAWSADGTRVAFAAQVAADGPFAIFTANGDGTDITQVTSGSDGDFGPTWSPDGTRIAFARTSGIDSGIFIVDVAGGDPQRLTSSSDFETEPSWSPDGSRIAYVARGDPHVCTAGCRFRLFVAAADGSGSPIELNTWWSFDAREPDWSPDGSRAAFTVADGSDPIGIQAIGLDGGDPRWLVTFGTPRNASWSPDGARVAFEETSSPALLSSGLDGTGLALIVDGPVTDPAWIPDPDRTGPSLELFVETTEDGWVVGSPPLVFVRAVDPSGVAGVVCTVNGKLAHVAISMWDPDLLAGSIRLEREGMSDVACTAIDTVGNRSAESSVQVRVDLSPPIVEPPTFSLNPKPVDGSTVVSSVATDALSGVGSGEFSVGSYAGFGAPMTLEGSTLTGVIGSEFTADLYPVRVWAWDRVGLLSDPAQSTLVVYDPSAGSVSGTGYIVPEGSGFAGKASFGFAAKYQSADSSVPSGNLSYNDDGAGFHLKSTGLQWLVVTGSDVAYFQGTARVHGLEGDYTFRVKLRDGDANGAPDRFAIRVYAPGADPDRDYAVYGASGDVPGGQIKIKR